VEIRNPILNVVQGLVDFRHGGLEPLDGIFHAAVCRCHIVQSGVHAFQRLVELVVPIVDRSAQPLILLSPVLSMRVNNVLKVRPLLQQLLKLLYEPFLLKQLGQLRRSPHLLQQLLKLLRARHWFEAVCGSHLLYRCQLLLTRCDLSGGL